MNIDNRICSNRLHLMILPSSHSPSGSQSAAGNEGGPERSSGRLESYDAEQSRQAGLFPRMRGAGSKYDPNMKELKLSPGILCPEDAIKEKTKA